MRHAHPFHMYEHIRSCPEAFRSQATAVLQEGGPTARLTAGRRRIYVTGIGTSFHAALFGERLLRPLADSRTVRAYHAMDFCLEPPPFGEDSALWTISHRATKGYSVEATRRVRERGGLTVLITGQGAPGPNHTFADAVIATVPQEQSSAHTVSYFGAVGTLAALALLTTEAAGIEPRYDQATILQTVPKSLEALLDTEATARKLAAHHAGRRRIWLLGYGPGAVLAQEIALKIKETSYLLADGMSVEACMHGPFQASESSDLFILISPEVPGADRMRAFARQAQAVGASILVLTDRPSACADAGPVETLEVPTLPGPFWSLGCQIPLLLFTYHLALTLGTDPDGFRLEDPRFLEASKRAAL